MVSNKRLKQNERKKNWLKIAAFARVCMYMRIAWIALSITVVVSTYEFKHFYDTHRNEGL